MRTKVFSAIMILFLCAAVSVQAQSYEKLWSEVKAMQQKGRPRTVVDLTEKIFRKARTERNAPQMMKAYLTGMEYQMEISPDSLSVGIQGMERWLLREKDEVDRAVLHSILASLYRYYWDTLPFNRTTVEVSGNLPANMSEWGGNVFMQKIVDHFKLSLAHPELLAKTSTEAFSPIVEKGDMSRYFHHDLYHLLGKRAADGLLSLRWRAEGLPDRDKGRNTAEEIYRSMLQFYTSRGDLAASALVDLDRIQALSANQLSKTYSGKLAEMISQYADTDVCVEIYRVLADTYRNQGQPAKALELVRKGIRKYPSYFRIDVLKQMEESILRPVLTIRTERVVYPGSPFKLSVNYVNVTGFTIEFSSKNPATGKTKVFKREFALNSSPDYLQKDTVFEATLPETGRWQATIRSWEKAEKRETQDIYVTRLKVIQLGLPQDQTKFVVVDAMSGHPVPQAKIQFYKEGRAGSTPQLVKEMTTDLNGVLICSGANWYTNYRAMKGNDNAMPQGGNSYNRYFVSKESDESVRLNLFTDRSIYRPGQTVYVSGLAYTLKGDQAETRNNQAYTLQLYDANNKMVVEKKLATNEFGTFAGDFQLPSSCLPGYFCLQAGTGSVGFRVEEYKRPTFDVNFLPVTQTYGFGDSLWVTGIARTFSGVPVQHATVDYSVNRSNSMLWRIRYSGETVSTGTVTTDEKGEFRIPLYFQRKDESKLQPYYFYTYAVEARVTDGAGETQNGTLSLPLGNVSLVLSADLPKDIMRGGNDSLTVKARNLSGEPIPVQVELSLYTQADSLRSVWHGKILSNRAYSVREWDALPSGSYRLVCKAKDDQGREVKQEAPVVLFSLSDKRPPFRTTDWFKVINPSFSESEPGVLLLGTSEKDVSLFYTLFAGNRLLESKTIQLTDTVVKFEYPYQESYGGSLMAQFAFVRNGELYQNSATFALAQPDKKLGIKWETFRDKLRPGQKEEWTLRITRPDGKPADAELLAVLYDASLDQLYPHNWNFGFSFFRPSVYTRWNTPQYWNDFVSFTYPGKNWKYKAWAYDRLIIGFTTANFYARGLTGNTVKSSMMPVASMRADKASVEDAVTFEAKVESAFVEETGTADQQLRENFAETAFFYPQLRTDAQGNVTLSFTLPESLTEWKFMGLAHTRTMDYGQLEAKVTASKDFMLVPNYPRFLRTGDEAFMPASVMNLSGKDISGTVRMELFDPQTEQVFVKRSHSFNVKAGETTNVNFSFTVEKGWSLLACRMIAEGGTFSDGEQRLIPILSNKQWVVETLAMAVNGKETRTFSLSGLFNRGSRSATDKKLTIEFTGNPAWYAVQALPSLTNPANDNTISWASAFYANNVSAYIANSNPRLKAVFDSWKQQGGNPETLWSNLQKNQELKTILLEESPWITEATNEAEQKQRISTLFDLNTLQYDNEQIVRKLKEFQNQEGAWSWYKGMGSNQYVTTFVVEALSRVPVLTGHSVSQEAQSILDKGWTYLHEENLRIYREMKKNEAKGIKQEVLPQTVLKYLYLCALTGQKIPAANREAHQYFLNKIEKSLANQNLLEKAYSAVILDKSGRSGAARDFILSLKEYAVQTPEMGIYYDSQAAPYSPSAYRIPTQVAVLEAMQLVAHDQQTVEQMKIWLLKQKQTQAWDSPVATVNAVYALLNRGTDLLANRGDVRITLGKKVIETFSSSKENVPGLGYVKETFQGKELTPQMKEITVQKRDPGIAWGAVYAQYMEETDKITKAGGPLSIDKKLYVETWENDRRVLTPLSEVKEARVGDKLVSRLTIKSGRDMDFVQLKDQRAACLEPSVSLSGYRWDNGLGYYQALKDASTEYFFDNLRKGTYVIEFSFYVTRAGVYSSGIATLQSAYAPEFSAHSASEVVKVREGMGK